MRRSVGRVLRVGGCTCSLLLLTAPVVSSFHRKYSWLTTGVMRLLTQRRSKSSGAGKIDFLSGANGWHGMLFSTPRPEWVAKKRQVQGGAEVLEYSL